MNCWYCKTQINGKPWDHLENIDDYPKMVKILKLRNMFVVINVVRDS